MKRNPFVFWTIMILPCAAFGAQEVYNFESESMLDSPGAVKQSTHFVFTLTGEGDSDNLNWEIKQDSNAPSPKNVLAITKSDSVANGFPMALLKGQKFQDCDVTVKFKILSGNVGQAGGLIIRAVDADHCFLVRASALDNTVVILRVNKEEHTKLASGNATVSVNRWNTLRVVAKATEFQVYFNDSKLISATDVDYPLGKVGMATQGDSVTYFDDFAVSSMK